MILQRDRVLFIRPLRVHRRKFLTTMSTLFDISKLLIRSLFLLFAGRLLARWSLRVRLHASLRGNVTEILHNTTFRTTNTNWDTRWVRLVGVRGRSRVHKLMLHHLLKELLIVWTHIICLSKTVNELLTQRRWWRWTTLLLLSQIR